MRAVVIGDERRLGGYALAGAEVLGVEDWPSVGDDVVLVVLTEEAYAALAPRLAERAGLIWAVLP